jgi:hypothetical protein
MAYENTEAPADEGFMSNVISDDTEMPAEDVTTRGAKGDTPDGDDGSEAAQAEKEHVAKIIRDIRLDKRYFAKAFKRMKRDMFVATHGRDETWSENNYKANIAGRHVKSKTATLYAKNPKATARRAEKLDFAVWDEDPQSLMLAMQAVQQNAMAEAQHVQAQQVAMAAQPPMDPMAAALMGHNGPPIEPFQPSPQAVEGQSVLADFQQGMERRKLLDKVGKTLEILFSKALRDQQPVDFKTAAKQLRAPRVHDWRRLCRAVFQRDYGPRPGLDDELTDVRTRLDHLKVLSDDVQSGETYACDAEMDELTRAWRPCRASRKC